MQRGVEGTLWLQAIAGGGCIPHTASAPGPHTRIPHSYNAQDQNKSVGKETAPMSVMSDTTVPFSQLTNTATTTTDIKAAEAPVTTTQQVGSKNQCGY